MNNEAGYAFWVGLIFLTGIYEARTHAADLSQTRFCLGFYRRFFYDGIGMLFETTFLRDLLAASAPLSENMCDKIVAGLGLDLHLCLLGAINSPSSPFSHCFSVAAPPRL